MKSWLKQNLIWIVAIALLLFILNQLPFFINLVKNIFTSDLTLDIWGDTEDDNDLPDDSLIIKTDRENYICNRHCPQGTSTPNPVCRDISCITYFMLKDNKWDLSD